MAKGQDFSKYQKGIIHRYYEHRDTIALQKLGEIVSELYLAESPTKKDRLWASAEQALKSVTANPAQVQKVLQQRSIEALAQLLNDISLSAKAAPRPPAAPTPAPATPATPPAPPAASIAPAPPGSTTDQPGAAAAPSPETLKSALKAFRKRLKLTRLDEESKLGHRAMTSGHRSGVVAITPPTQFPRQVWEELANQGKLKRAGGGLYELVGE